MTAATDDRPLLATHTRLATLVGLGLLGVLMITSLGIGSVPLTVVEVVGALIGDPAQPFHLQIVQGLRLPRLLIASLAGAMLAAAGAVLQTVTRNELADPSLVGVTGGGVFAVVVTIAVLGVDPIPAPWSPVIAMVGALAAGAAVYALGWRGGREPRRMVLYGVFVGAVLSSLVSVMLLLDGEIFGVVLRWVIGSLNGRVWTDLSSLLTWAAIAIPAALVIQRRLVALWLGDDVAESTGALPARSRLVGFVCAVALTAGAISIVGAIGFIGLIAPHLSRLVVGSHPSRSLPLAMLIGAGLLVGADAAAELLSNLIGAAEIGNRARLPAGALTALTGGPLLLWLLTRKARA